MTSAVPPLVVKAENLQSGTTVSYRITRSPGRIGRNALNDVPLEEGFVSQFHGLLRFDAHEIHFVDLGSTNGTLVDGARAETNLPYLVTPNVELRIGPLRLSVQRDSTAPGRAPSGLARTMAPFGGEQPRDRPGVSPLAEVAGRFLPPGKLPHSDEEMKAFAQGTTELLAVFATAFVGLKRGLEQSGNELGVRTVSGSSPLYKVREPAEVLSYLLDFRADRAARLKELLGVFADFGIHQVALLNGITESVKSLLDRLDPEAAAGKGLSKLLGLGDGRQKLVEAFRELRDDERHLHAAIFGDAFARAYAASALDPSNDPKPEPVGTGPISSHEASKK